MIWHEKYVQEILILIFFPFLGYKYLIKNINLYNEMGFEFGLYKKDFLMKNDFFKEWRVLHKIVEMEFK